MARKITGITVKLGLDGKEVTSQLKSLDKAIAKSSSELREIDRALKLDPTNTELLAQKQEVLAQALEKSREKLQALEQMQNTAAKAAANNTEWEQAYAPIAEAIEKVTAELRDLQKEKEEMDKKLASGEISQAEYDEYIAKLNEAKQAQKDLRKQKEELDARFAEGHITADEYRAYCRELEQVRAETARLEAETQQLDNVTDESSQSFRQAVQSTRQYQQAMDELERSSAEFGAKMKSALSDIWNLSLKVGAALASMAVTGIGASVKVGTSFDASMSNVEALSRAAGDELAALRAKAEEMGATTSKSATEAADALGYMALAGWDTEQMLGGIEPILRASEAGAMDLATASDLVTDSMSAMGISVNDLTHYLDVATKAQSSSNTSLEQLLNAYVIAGGTFKNFNVSLEESSALLGILANRGIKGSEAGNSLNSVLINLIGASSTSANAMEELGISAYDADGNFIGITETLRLVSGALENLDQQQRDFFIAKLGGKTQYDTLQALLSGVNDEYDVLYGKLEQSNGALLETAAIMQDNLKGNVTTFTSALEDLGIQVNDQFKDKFREAVQAATVEVGKLAGEVSDGEIGESIQKIAEAFGEAIKQIAKFAAEDGIPKTVEFLGFIADHGDAIVGIVAAIGGAFVGWKIAGIVLAASKAFQTYNAAVILGATNTEALNIALKSLGANPVFMIQVAAIGALVAGLIAAAVATKNWIEELDEIENTGPHMEGFLEDCYESIEALEKQREEFDKLSASMAESEAGEMAQISRLDELWKELQGYVDENGKVISSNERASEIIGLLNNNYDMNIGYIDGQIQAYGELAGSMDQYIEKLRQEARIRNRQPAYDEAVKNYDELEKRLEDLAAKEEQTLAAFELAGKNKNADVEGVLAVEFGAIKKEKAAIEAELEGYKQVIDDYEGLFGETVDIINSVTDDVAKGSGEGLGEDGTIVDDLEERFKKLQEEWEAAEFEFADPEGAIKTEEQLYSAKLKIWGAYGDKDIKEHQKYYLELIDIHNEFAEEDAKIAEEENKKRLEAQRKSLEEQIKVVEDAVKEIESEYSGMLKDISAEQDAYKNKLLDVAELFTSEKKTDEEGNEYELFTLENIDKQIQAVEAYDNKLKKLEARGAGAGLLSYVQGLSQDDSEKVMHVLGTMTDEQLKAYSDKYDKLIDTVNERAEDRYAPQVEAVNAGFVEKIRAIMGELPEEMSKVGTDSIDGFIRGFTGKESELIGSVSEYCNGLLNSFKSNLDINSPSKETEALGEYVGEGFEKGLASISGADAARTFADDFIAAMAEKDSELRDVLYGAFAGNAASAIAAMNAETGAALKGLPQFLRLPVMPSVKLPKAEETEAALTARTDTSPINALIEEVLDVLGIIENRLAAMVNREQVIPVTIPVTTTVVMDGKPIAEKVSTYQTEIRRMTRQ